MKQWELRGVTDPFLQVVRDDGSEADDTIVVLERFPAVLWTTDVCLGFTSSPSPGMLSVDLPMDPSDGDLFDLAAPDEFGADVVEAHLAALRGDTGTCSILEEGHRLRCIVVPLPDAQGHTTGTICIALDSSPVDTWDENAELVELA